MVSDHFVRTARSLSKAKKQLYVSLPVGKFKKGDQVVVMKLSLLNQIKRELKK